MESIEYLVPDWVRVRRESFGLLFYDTRSTRLTFVRSRRALEPPPFVGGDRRLQVMAAGTQLAVARLLNDLVARGLLLVREAGPVVPESGGRSRTAGRSGSVPKLPSDAGKAQ